METAALLAKKHEHQHLPVSGVKRNFTLGGSQEGPIQCTFLMRRSSCPCPSFTLLPKVLQMQKALGFFFFPNLFAAPLCRQAHLAFIMKGW